MSQVKRKTEGYTAGEWQVMPGQGAPRICVDGDKEWPIVVQISGHSEEGIKANERLISAAPDLVTILALIEHSLRLGLEVSQADLRKARKALKKAGVLA